MPTNESHRNTRDRTEAPRKPANRTAVARSRVVLVADVRAGLVGGVVRRPAFRAALRAVVAGAFVKCDLKIPTIGDESVRNDSSHKDDEMQ